MHLIVTHDNADFDAVASLLGAAKLYPGALPVIPRRVNRNVRDFLHLYWEEFPFVWAQDVPTAKSSAGKARIARLTVVDSQHVPSLKEMDAETQFQFIDHHAPSKELPPGAFTTLQSTGATATLMVEEMQRQQVRLTPNEATLLLLGIYEDTGSLTYAGTTPRDIRAAAWLLEQGASLDVLRQFLNYPLSETQRALYDRLVESYESYDIEGRNVMIAVAQADGYVEEISTLAHKLRDLFEPDALFLAVAMEDHTQLVARSTTNAIEVDAIAAHFGGGGHPRAAAALIHSIDLAQIRDQLLAALRQHVQPATMVGQIMSHGVRTLAPTDTVSEAAAMMARYGHESFPVVENGEIVGVLTRREIDKAMHHKLGGSAVHQYMRKGRLFVTPSDSVEKLQALMIQEGLGQVPVVEDDRIVGIVTRTDLINLWTEAPRPSRTDEIAERLAMAVPKRLLELLREAGQLAAEQGDSLFIVGGFVRDLLLGNPTLDIDLVIEGDAIRLARRLARRYGGRVRSHRRFGTAKWLISESRISGQTSNVKRQTSNVNSQTADRRPQTTDHGSPISNFPRPVLASGPGGGQSPISNLQSLPPTLDFVTARAEYYEHPSALPEVERSSIKQDLHRRDFTINTLAIELTPNRYGELLDFYGGENDLRQGLIRVLHSLSFVEDATRMARAARLEQRLGFRLEARTEELLRDALDLLDRVSGERIYHELHLIFGEAEPERALLRLDDLGVLRQIHPALRADKWFAVRCRELREGLSDTPWSWSAPASDSAEGEAAPGRRPTDVHYLGLLTFRLAAEALDGIVDRLRIRGDDAAILHQIQALKARLAELREPRRPSQIHRLLGAFDEATLLIGWLTCTDETARAQLAQFQRELRGVEPIIDGHYLRRELNLRPGPIYRQVLEHLRAARLDGEVITLADERALAERWLAEHGKLGS
jgi:tRNA nucleotidyltransferase (CCA-adding enzyme)